MLSAIRDNRGVDDWAESDLAWQLAEVACLLLPDRDRVEVYTAIGAGYNYGAIEAMLETVVRAGTPVPPALLARIADWLNGYAHHQDAPRLQRILAALEIAS